jgi:ankyrin repeat protein
MLLAADYAEKHDIQQAALAGDTLALRNLLGPEPKAIAKGVTGDLDEPLITDALEHPATLRALLELGLDPNQIGASGRTPLMVAARLDLLDAADILLSHGAAPDTGAGDPVAQTDSTGDPLCMTGNVAVSDAPGRTALSYAAELGSSEMVRLLIDRGASAARSDGTGRRPTDYVERRSGEPAQAAKISEMLK